VGDGRRGEVIRRGPLVLGEAGIRRVARGAPALGRVDDLRAPLEDDKHDKNDKNDVWISDGREAERRLPGLARESSGCCSSWAPCPGSGSLGPESKVRVRLFPVLKVSLPLNT
jgi:hypothetical protein